MIFLANVLKKTKSNQLRSLTLIADNILMATSFSLAVHFFNFSLFVDLLFLLIFFIQVFLPFVYMTSSVLISIEIIDSKNQLNVAPDQMNTDGSTGKKISFNRHYLISCLGILRALLIVIQLLSFVVSIKILQLKLPSLGNFIVFGYSIDFRLAIICIQSPFGLAISILFYLIHLTNENIKLKRIDWHLFMVIADAFWLHALVFNVILFSVYQEKQIFLLKLQLELSLALIVFYIINILINIKHILNRRTDHPAAIVEMTTLISVNE